MDEKILTGNEELREQVNEENLLDNEELREQLNEEDLLDNETVNTDKRLKKGIIIGRVFIIVAIVLIILGSIFVYKGFDKKNNYYKSDYFGINTYVGGDAYNSIINGNYFTGYMTLGGNMYICATLLMCFGMFYIKSHKNHES